MTAAANSSGEGAWGDPATAVISELLAGRRAPIDLATSERLINRHPMASRLLVSDGHGTAMMPPPLRVGPGCDDRDGARWSTDEELHALFDALMARSEGGFPARSTIAVILRDAVPDWATEARLRADKLDWLVSHWLRQRLWSLNRAPELIAHDERHVAAVESLIAALVEPFWTEAAWPHFLPIELEWLSVAAWLHDWGHVGGAVAPWEIGGVDGIVGSSRDVRVLHGLISQHLLGQQWFGMHGVDEATAGPAGVLCGHHQSWTSFGTERPQKRKDRDTKPDPVALLDELGLQPVTLEEDVARLEGLPPFVDLSRFRLLVALVRVADGADVGRHRVPDIGAGRNGFLARCIHQEAMRTADVLRFVAEHEPSVQRGVEIAHMVALEARRGGRGESLDSVTPIAATDIPEIEELRRYRDFVLEQGEHFDKHQLVDAVRFEFVDDHFDVVVVPSDVSGSTAQTAVDAVADDVRRELDHHGVRPLLERNGIRFGRARTPRSYAPAAERDLARPGARD